MLKEKNIFKLGDIDKNDSWLKDAGDEAEKGGEQRGAFWMWWKCS